MTTLQLIVFALAAGGTPAAGPALGVPTGERIEVSCSSAIDMTAINGALDQRRRWASQNARRQMLSVARAACRNGAAVVTFAAPAGRSCRSPPRWTTFCLDLAASDRASQAVPQQTSGSAPNTRS